MATRLAEQFDSPGTPRVDREKGVIYGVKVLGVRSRNGRLYPEGVIRNAVAKYEGLKAYIDHPKPGEAGDRSYRDWAGRYRNCRLEGTGDSFGIYADLKVKQSHPMSEALLDDAEDPDFSKDFGVSHVALCDSHVNREGVEEVTEIVEPLSGDIVTEPATVSGLYESKAMPTDTKRRKRTFAEIRGLQRTGTTAAKLLFEMDEAYLAPEDEVETEGDDPQQIAKQALRDLVMSAFDDESLDMDATLARIGEILQMQSSMNGETPEESSSEEGSEPSSDTPAGPPKPPAETEESRRLAAKLALAESRNALLESGREATDARVKALASAAKVDRKALLESWPKASRPGRPEAPGLYTESDGDLPPVAEYEKKLLEAAGR